MYRRSQVLFLMTILATASETACSQKLVLVGETSRQVESFVGVDEESFSFQQEDSAVEIPRRNLVRWSHPQTNLKRAEVALIDGSRIVLADSWGNESSLRVEGDTALLSTNAFGRLQIPLEELQAAVVSGPHDLHRRAQLWDSILQPDAEYDAVYLTNGDVLAGALGTINASVEIELSASGSDEPLSLPTGLASALRWKGGRKVEQRPGIAIGLRDGSYLMARRVDQDGERVAVELVGGQQLTVPLRQVVHLQQLGAPLQYLSDLKPKEYLHRPYLQLARPLQNDRNVLAQPLQTANRRYAKGLGMSTAAEAIYEVPSGYRRFATQVALDDAAKPTGSVVFQVSLLEQGHWKQAFTGETISSGDAPRSVAIELNGATEIKLEALYGDRGDQQDYANWLDARFER